MCRVRTKSAKTPIKFVIRTLQAIAMMIEVVKTTKKNEAIDWIVIRTVTINNNWNFSRATPAMAKITIKALTDKWMTNICLRADSAITDSLELWSVASSISMSPVGKAKTKLTKVMTDVIIKKFLRIKKNQDIFELSAGRSTLRPSMFETVSSSIRNSGQRKSC